MARVRRLVVSQIEGGNSDDSDKRPNGEIALYEDNNSGFDLVIHDGVNPTSDNRIFGKGKFYGHGSDSGDGNGYNTIKLIPDTDLFSSDQYIVVDPTSPGHIHLRAGGEIDNSNAYLYLGGEKYHVMIDDNSFVAISAKEDIEDPNPGQLTSSGIYVASGQVSISYSQQDNFGMEEGRFQWDFHPDSGLLQLPSNGGGIQFGNETIQNTAWTGGRVVESPTSSVGVTGDLLGDISFSSGYLYYCTQNYNGDDNVWKRVAWSNDTW
jgi:hypothetical protein